jgi:L-ascorbate metabolism protein UlaG (beta-lactamase superfamily)
MTELPRLTYIGGPTLLLEWRGLRLLTDPTFDSAGTSYPTAVYTLRKTIGPARSADRLGPIDAVLLSHDHHFDNLDHSGRELLPTVGSVFTTVAAAGRLGGNARGLLPEASVSLEGPDGGRLTVTATPARHGPAHSDRGPVIGFLLSWEDDPSGGIYLTGDTVWYEGVEQVRARGPVLAVVAFLGAAKVKVAGDAPLTLTAAEGVELARAFAPATVVPVHFEGWEHFTESRREVEQAFAAAGIAARLQWLPPGRTTPLASSMRPSPG